MTVPPNSDTSEPAFLGRLRPLAAAANMVGAVGSVAFTLYAGRHNRHYYLTVLFVIWVLSPYALLALANRISERWSAATRSALYGAMVLVTLGSLIVYAADAAWPRQAQAAFVYVVVAPISWLAIAVVLSTAALLSGDLSRRR